MNKYMKKILIFLTCMLMVNNACAKGAPLPPTILTPFVQAVLGLTLLSSGTGMALCVAAQVDNIKKNILRGAHCLPLFNATVRTLNNISYRLIYLIEKRDKQDNDSDDESFIFDLGPLQHIASHQIESVKELNTINTLQQLLNEQLDRLNTMIKSGITSDKDIEQKNILCRATLDTINQLRRALGYYCYTESGNISSYRDVSIAFRLQEWLKIADRKYGGLFAAGTCIGYLAFAVLRMAEDAIVSGIKK